MMTTPTLTRYSPHTQQSTSFDSMESLFASFGDCEAKDVELRQFIKDLNRRHRRKTKYDWLMKHTSIMGKFDSPLEQGEMLTFILEPRQKVNGKCWHMGQFGSRWRDIKLNNGKEYRICFYSLAQNPNQFDDWEETYNVKPSRFTLLVVRQDE